MKQTALTTTLALDAYGIIRKRLVGGEMRLGEAISRRKLAAELRMSFLPVTIALLRLEYEGFIESRPRAGTRVRIPSRQELHGHYVLREALETHAAKLFATRADEKLRGELRRLAEQVDALSVQPDRVSYVRAHHKFHKRIVDGTGCATLTSSIEGVHALAAMWFCAMHQPADDRQPRRHRELAAALTQGTPEAAADAMRAHIVSGLEHALEALKPYFALRTRSSGTFVRSGVRR
jgi:DNA-binding GntR family transcriptional regulator